MRQNDGWFKSSASTGNGQCVEVQFGADGEVLVRDSKDRGGPALRFTRGEWAAFLVGAGNGEFNQG